MISLLGGIVFGGGLGLIAYCCVKAWRFVFVPDHGDCPSGTALSSFGSSHASRVSPPAGASIDYRGARG